MSQAVSIHVHDVHKSFITSRSGVASLKTLALWWRKPPKKVLSVLKGVSFDVHRGECLALVGRNGAGKSTLLSLIARIYKPNQGNIQVTGRLAPLLELGAGFHPDLTGVDNILFNAVVLGLSREEARSRMPAIIEFSELGEAVHQPVRTLSSGMLARLGFAIAVHVDADILLVDEVLSVGDYRFEEKCRNRIEEFRAQGGTIVLVSHSARTVQMFADRCIWLENGQVRDEGDPERVIQAYLGQGGV
jgi:ABC-type polysaccharide/polyol phosphate transport system ATPase subunit